jgi:DNA-binding NarL/FixJ family response regulator
MSDIDRSTTLRGHDGAMRLIHSRLDALLTGRGGVVVVDGAAGMGKSVLLAEVRALGARRGARVLHAICDVLTYPMQLAPLLTAVTDGPEPVLNLDELLTMSRSTDHYFWQAGTLQAALERAALERPLLVAIDDLHWADETTLAALTLLVGRVAGRRVLWLIAVNTQAASPMVSVALDRLERGGAARISLGPLTLSDAIEIVRDLLGTDAGQELPSALAGLETQPRLLVEMLRGMQEEGSIEVVDGTAKLVAAGLPSRVRELVAGQLRRLSTNARHIVQLGAALGQRFTAGELAAMADVSPVTLIAAVKEATTAGLLASHDDSLCFRHQLVREAIEGSLPAPLFSALRRRAVTVRLESGAPADEVVELVLAASRQGDKAAAELLDRAAIEIGRAAPAMAVRLSRRAMELSVPDDPNRPGLIARTADHLIRDGRLAEVRSLISASAGELTGVTAAATTLIGMSMLALQTDPRQSIELSERCQRLPELSPPMRALCLAVTACSWYVVGDAEAADEAVERLVALAEASADPVAATVVLIPMALRAMHRHEWQRSLELAEEAVRAVSRTVAEQQPPGDLAAVRSAALRHWIPEAWLALLLTAAVRTTEALDVIEAGLDAARQRGLTPMVLAWTIARARARLEAGRLAEARQDAEQLLSLAAESNAPSGYITDLAHYVIGCSGLHLGRPDDLDRSRAAIARLQTADLPLSRQVGAWLTARLTATDKVVELPSEDLGGTVLTITYPGSHSDAVRLIRIFMDAGHRERAEALSSQLSALAGCHPGFPFLRAAAAQARAIVEADPDLAMIAATLHLDDPRPLVKASALEDAGRLLPSTAREQAVTYLTEALSLYMAAGAEFDVTRVRALLRERGVRRTAATQPPTGAWSELTEAEFRVAQLVATGSTNRVIADRLHLSPHTVNTHLRHIFSKLGVRSRVVLTRMVTERLRQSQR